MKRFWDKVDKRGPAECWLWKAGKSKKGCGAFYLDGKLHPAPRVSFLIHNGHWPEPMCLHSCDNPACVNPAHLRAGTASENTKDMTDRRRGPHGSAMWASKLSEQSVNDIRANYLLCRVSQRELAIRYQVSQCAIWHIVNRRTWRHV